MSQLPNRLSGLILQGVADHIAVRSQGTHRFNLMGFVQLAPDGQAETCFAGATAINTLRQVVPERISVEDKLKLTALSTVAFNMSQNIPAYARINNLYNILEFTNMELPSKLEVGAILLRYAGLWDETNALNRLGTIKSMAIELEALENNTFRESSNTIFIDDEKLKEEVVISNRGNIEDYSTHFVTT